MTTIAEYIEALSKLPPNAPVFTDYEEFGLVEVEPDKLKLVWVEKVEGFGHRYSWDNNEKSFDALVL